MCLTEPEMTNGAAALSDGFVFCRFDSAGEVRFRFRSSLRQRFPFRQFDGKRCGKRAARTVGVFRLNPLYFKTIKLFPVKKDIYRIKYPVPAFHKNRAAAVFHYSFRRVFHILFRFYFQSR